MYDGKSEGVTDGESSESAEEEDVTSVGTSELEIERLE